MIGRRSDDEKAAGQGSLEGVTLKEDFPPSSSADEPTSAGGNSAREPRMRFSYANGDRPLDGYTIKRGVGVGGFGEVYYAVSDAGKEVALKRVQRNIDIELRGVRHCLNLKSPHLVAIFDLKDDAHGDVWIVMEYVHGESLKGAIERNSSGMERGELVRWFLAMAEGVAHLHEHGIVHRDLKPANIFDDQGTVKVGDYGLSKFISCSRRDGHTESVGTIHYMAPEIGKGDYGKEIDIYALGVILYEMATGDVPFNGESAQEILFKHLTAEPDLSGLDPQLRGIVARCLHKDPAQRFHQVREIVAALSGETVASREHIAAAPPAASAVVSERVDAIAPAAPHTSPSPPPPASDPFAAAIGNGWQRVRTWWYTSSMGKPAKVAIVAGAVAAALINAEWLVPTVLVLSTLYVMYLAARALSLPGFAPATESGAAPASPLSPPTHAAERTPPRTTPLAPAGQEFVVRAELKRPRYAPPPVRPRSSRKQHDAAVRRFLASQPLSAKTGSWLTSALLAAGICAGMTLVVTSCMTQVPLDYATATWWAPVLWTTWVSTFGSWVLLVLDKRWASESEQDSPRRFVQFFAGLLLGIFAFGFSRWLLFDLSPAASLTLDDFPTLWIPDTMYGPDGAPLLAAFLVYFGSLFLIVRWWRLADPLRRHGFRLGRIFVAGLAAWLLAELWRFPEPWGVLVAVNMSVALQIASAWISPARREAIAANEVVPAEPSGGHNAGVA